MKTGEALEFIRKNKNISLKQICGNQLSRTTYYRIAHDKVDVTYYNLKIILDNLHVSSDEFDYISNNFKQDKINSDIIKIRTFFEKNDITSLRMLSMEYEKLKEINQSYLHVYCLVEILKSKLLKSQNPDAEHTIRDYLNNIETWTHYETVLFNNSMFIFSSEFIEITISKALQNLTKYSTLRAYGSESFRMLINVLILFIDRKEIIKANYILEMLKSEYLKDDFLFEKLCLKFFDNILLFINGKSNKLEEAHNTIKILSYIGSTDTSSMFSSYLENIKYVYN